MTLNELRDKVFEYEEKQGFHEKPYNFGESLMLIVSELSEALEADRKGMYSGSPCCSIETDIQNWAALNGCNDMGFAASNPEIIKKWYEQRVKGSVEEEFADAILRLCALAKRRAIDLDWHIVAKMAYNETRPYKHGKKYGR
jgi:NTP pyrophosphatase (non-canonical NTP hydrolase)